MASLGSDAPRKQELPPELLRTADLYTDLPTQSLTIGEFQHLATEWERSVTAIGRVITKSVEGRVENTAITVFDSSGIGLQDLYAARAIINELRTRSESLH